MVKNLHENYYKDSDDINNKEIIKTSKTAGTVQFYLNAYYLRNIYKTNDFLPY